MRVLKATDEEVLELAFSPDGRAVAAAFCYHGVYLWNLEATTPAPVRMINAYGYCKGGLNFSADSRSLSWLAVGGRRTYNRDTRQTIVKSFAVTKITYGLTVSADGTQALSRHGVPDNCLIGWTQTEGEWFRTWKVSTAELSAESLTLSPTGRLFALFTRPALGGYWWQLPRQLELRDTATAKLLGVGEYPYNYACPLVFSPDCRQLVGFNHMKLLIWSVSEQGSLGLPHLVRNDSRKHFTSIAYHPSGRYLYATSNDTTVHVFDTTTWDRVTRFTWQLGRLRAITVSPDGTLAATGSKTGDVVIWDVDL